MNLLQTIEAVGGFVISGLILWNAVIRPQGRGNGYQGYDQRGSYRTEGPYYAPSARRPVARSSSFLSNLVWLLVLAGIVYVLLNMYAPSILHALLHHFITWM